MRLIDADALIESLSINPEDCPGCPEPEWLEELADILALAPTVDAIDRQPTIDAVPVKHGKWIPHPFEKEWDVCSSCGTGCKRREREFDHLGQKSVTEYNYQYCPWCGAKMDGGRTDEQT